MKVYVYIILLIIMAPNTQAFTLDQTIDIKGYGNLFSETNTYNAKDMVNGVGNQYYHKKLYTRSDVSDLVSNYSLSSAASPNDYYYISIDEKRSCLQNKKNVCPDFQRLYPKYATNQYSISMRTPGGLQEVLSVHGIMANEREFVTNNSITFQPLKKKKTGLGVNSYNLVSSIKLNGVGNLSDEVSNIIQDRHPLSISKSSASGNVNFKSKFADLIKISDSETAELSEKGEGTRADADKEKQSSPKAFLTLSQIEEMLMQGIITQKEYLARTRQLLDASIISVGEYVSTLAGMKERQLIDISDTEYKELIAESSPITIGSLMAELDANNVNLEDYLKRLNEGLKRGRLSETDYLVGIRKLQLKGNVSIDEYDRIKKDILMQLRDKVLNNKIDPPEYKTILLNLKDKQLISDSEYTNQFKEYYQDIVGRTRTLYDRDVLDELEFLTRISDPLKNGWITDTEFNQMKKEALGRLSDNLLQNKDDTSWVKFEDTLNEMLNRSLINEAERYDQIHNTALAMLTQLEGKLSKNGPFAANDFITYLQHFYNEGYITKIDYIEKLNVLVNKGLMSESEFNGIKNDAMKLQ
jgi:hypothetical protein